MPKKIIRAKVIGFCYGVKRAVEIAEKTRQPLNTLGPLIHNPQEVERLAKKGKVPIDSLEQANEQTLLIRAHGVPDFIINRAKEKGLDVIDATCPYVTKAQALSKSLEKSNYKVIIIGKKKHPEIIGIVGNLKNAIVVENIKEAKKLGNYIKLGVIAQTTSNTEEVEKIITELNKHGQEVKIMETICQATEEHQAAARELAPQVDIMVVVGGKSSSNTTRLYEICQEYCDSYHIETPDDLDTDWFKNIEKIGIAAGASTPDWIIDSVIEKINAI